MESRVQKWGNSLALRIPKAFVDEMGLENNSSVRMMLKEGSLAWISTDNNLVKVGPNETGPSSSIATINYPTKVQLQVDPKAPKPG